MIGDETKTINLRYVTSCGLPLATKPVRISSDQGISGLLDNIGANGVAVCDAKLNLNLGPYVTEGDLVDGATYAVLSEDSKDSEDFKRKEKERVL